MNNSNCCNCTCKKCVLQMINSIPKTITHNLISQTCKLQCNKDETKDIAYAIWKPEYNSMKNVKLSIWAEFTNKPYSVVLRSYQYIYNDLSTKEKIWNLGSITVRKTGYYDTNHIINPYRMFPNFELIYECLCVVQVETIHNSSSSRFENNRESKEIEKEDKITKEDEIAKEKCNIIIKNVILEFSS